MFNWRVMLIWNMCLHYINVKLLTVPSEHCGSCTYHVSGSVLWSLSRNKYRINTRAKTNKIALRQFAASWSTSRHLHYVTHKHTFRHGASGSTVTVAEDKTLCPCEVNCVHRKCQDNITENINIESRHRDICIWLRHIAWHAVSILCDVYSALI